MPQRIIYPSYFDESLTRKEGRRIAKDKAITKPTCQMISSAARKAGFSPVEESKSHPAHAYEQEGRIIIEYTGSKEQLIAKIAEYL